MKVYVIKRNDGKYLSKHSYYDYRLENPCQYCWAEKLYNAKIFKQYIEANNFCNTIDCQIVECSFMEKTDLTDYTKQVKKEVCEEFKEKLKPKEIFHPEDEFTIDYDFYYKEDVEEILDQIQGETK